MKCIPVGQSYFRQAPSYLQAELKTNGRKIFGCPSFIPDFSNKAEIMPGTDPTTWDSSRLKTH